MAAMAYPTTLIYKENSMKRVVVTGAECTGKSTLTQALSAHYGEPWTAEYVREYVDQIGRELNHEDLYPIAKGQIEGEDALLPKAKRFVLHDTNLLSSILYAKHYFNTDIAWMNEAFINREYTLYLLCLPDGIPWQEDPGQRESPSARIKFHGYFKESLDRLELPYAELTGKEDVRISQATRAIDALI